MGCKAITPHLVSLAKRLEGRPFHLLASYCQGGTRDETVAYVQKQGLAEDTPNVTVSKQTRHPGVKGNGYVPYYVVFDHKGNMAYHHMCGAYHGGDGLKMIEWVDKLLDAAPDIYLGEESYGAIADLAAKVRKRKGLAATVRKLEALKADEGGGAQQEEATQLLERLGVWRDKQLQRIDGLLTTTPSAVVPELKDFAKELAGTTLQEPIAERLKALQTGDVLKRSLALEKVHAKVWKSVRKLKVPKAAKRQGVETFDPSNAACRAAQPKALAKAASKLEKALEGNDDLPFAQTVQRSIQRFR